MAGGGRTQPCPPCRSPQEPAGVTRARVLRAATALACLWAVAARGQPLPAQTQPDDPVPALPDARPGEVAVQLDADGALAAHVARQAPADDAHLCATLTLPGGRQDYLLRFGADPGASVLDPTRPGLVLTVAGLDDASSAQAGPRNGSLQVAIGGQTFFGSTQPGAPFRLEVSLLPGQDGGRLRARHLVDRTGQQVIDLDGAWRCAASPTAVATARPSAPDPGLGLALPLSADPATTGRAYAGTALAGAASPAATPTAPAPEPAVAPAGSTPPDLDAATAPGTPPATAFRHLLTELDRTGQSGGAATAPSVPAMPRAAAPQDMPHAHVLQALSGIAPPPPLPGVAAANPEFSRRRVFIHYRGGSRRGALVADDLARTLDPQFARTEIRTVAMTPGMAEVRYFFADDAAAAHALARRLGGAHSPWRVRSLTTFTPSPPPGTLELWVPER